jgi:hypothetical protein
MIVRMLLGTLREREREREREGKCFGDVEGNDGKEVKVRMKRKQMMGRVAPL